MRYIDGAARVAIGLIERGLMPEPLIRRAIRHLIGIRYRQLYQGKPEQQRARSQRFLSEAAAETVLALETEKANEQHYEVPSEFFQLVLGPHRKYSSCFYPEESTTLGEAEEAALEITCQRAGVENGNSILELGCGWGSLTLWLASHYPDSEITAVSNSASQREFILREASERGIDGRLEVITCDINQLELHRKFDRIVSIEMFEHVRNHRQLLERVAGWLAEDGQMFVHIFCHCEFAYPFETQGAANWMGRHFFSGGMMPNQDLFRQHSEHLSVVQEWEWNGRHYQRTANDWAARLDQNQDEVLRVFRGVYGVGQERKWLMRWKVFFLACAELFGFEDGNQWLVGHYRLRHTKGLKIGQKSG